MRHQTELSTWELARHVLIYSVGFTLFAVEAVYGAVVTSLASPFIESKFVRHVMTTLEYAIVVFTAMCIASRIIRDVRSKLKGLFNEE